MPSLLTIPIELRLMIYEYVVYCHKPIRPEQVCWRSNKFINWWSPRRRPEREHPEQDALSLSLVCRQIYQDLQRRPVFYRVNRFQFEDFYSLEVYLAAITPKQRKEIRHLVIFDKTQLKDSYLSLRLGGILSQCKNIKDLSLILVFSEYQNSNLKKWLGEYLKADGAVDYASGKQSMVFLLFLHFVRTFIAFKGTVDEDRDFSEDGLIRIGSSDEIPAAVWPTPLPILPEEKEIIEVFSAIDFPGEVRTEQTRLHDSIGPVSCRTRHKAHKADFSTGTWERETPHYDEEGLLLDDIYEVGNISWKGDSEIECDVYVRTRQWVSEPVHAILTLSGFLAVTSFYRHRLGWVGNPATVLGAMRSIPSPRDVHEVGDLGSCAPTGPTTKHSYWSSKAIRDWNSVMSQWERRTARLEKEVEKEARRQERIRAIQAKAAGKSKTRGPRIVLGDKMEG
ncbi:hypothetical protein Hte_003586 [Hypoxylon texense]